jgi:hypothetical protein
MSSRAARFLATVFFSSALFAQPPNYLPLQTGNTWLYHLKAIGPGDPYRSISVGPRQSVNGRDYYEVTWFGRQVLLRQDAVSGEILAFDRAAGSEKQWLSLQTADGASFPAAIDPCVETGTILSHNAKVSTAAGQFGNAVEVIYRGPCDDAGVTRQLFVPDVGLVLHVETSFTGARDYELVYYRAGGHSPAGPEIAFTVALDGTRYAPHSVLGARLTLRSTSPLPVLLVYPTGQSYDLKITNPNGEVVYQWSSGRAFPMIYGTENFGPGEKTYGIAAPLDDLPPGHYEVEGWLATSPVSFRGMASFEVVAPTLAPNRNSQRGER